MCDCTTMQAEGRKLQTDRGRTLWSGPGLAGRTGYPFWPFAAVFVIRNSYGASRESSGPLVRFEITTVKLSLMEHCVKDSEMVGPLIR